MNCLVLARKATYEALIWLLKYIYGILETSVQNVEVTKI